MNAQLMWKFVGVLTMTAAPGRAVESISPPICDAGGPYGEWKGCPIEFDGSGSQAPGGEIVSYVWNFGDGTTGEGVRPIHIYGVISWYRVVLTVTDDLGEASSCSTFAAVDSDNILPPLDCNAGGPYHSAIGDSVQFEVVAKVDESPSYQWDFGDGMTGVGPSPTHAYSAAGTYHVKLDVADCIRLACHCFERSGKCETTASIGVDAVKPTSWGFLKTLYR